jgi:hypothetical protein
MVSGIVLPYLSRVTTFLVGMIIFVNSLLLVNERSNQRSIPSEIPRRIPFPHMPMPMFMPT